MHYWKHYEGIINTPTYYYLQLNAHLKHQNKLNLFFYQNEKCYGLRNEAQKSKICACEKVKTTQEKSPS